MRHFASVHQLLSRKHLMAQFPDKWEPLLNNMGHVCRKLGRCEQAIAYHSQALRMCPSSASSYDAIGLVYSLKGELQTACDFFQKVRRRRSFRRRMRKRLTDFPLLLGTEPETRRRLCHDHVQHRLPGDYRPGDEPAAGRHSQCVVLAAVLFICSVQSYC